MDEKLLAGTRRPSPSWAQRKKYLALTVLGVACLFVGAVLLGPVFRHSGGDGGGGSGGGSGGTPTLAFVLYDAGETLGLRPAMLELCSEGSSGAKRFSCVALCATANAYSLLSDRGRAPPAPPSLRLTLLTLGEALARGGFPNRTAPLARDEALPPEQLAALAAQLAPPLGQQQQQQQQQQPQQQQGGRSGTNNVVVTGCVSALQQQLSVVLRRAATDGIRSSSAAAAAAGGGMAHVVAFDDGFSSWDNASRAAALLRAGGADEFIVSASPIARAVQAAAAAAAAAAVPPGTAAALLPSGVRALGDPGLEAWRATDTYGNASAAAATRAAVLARFAPEVLAAAGGAGAARLALYFGGYGGLDYNRSVLQLARLALLEHARANATIGGGRGSGSGGGGGGGGLLFAVSMHPGQGVAAAVEAPLLAGAGAPAVVLPPADEAAGALFDSASVAAACDATLSEDSTCGVQSLYVGVPSLYLQPPTAQNGSAAPPHAGNVATDAGLLPITHNASAAAAVLAGFRATDWHFDAARLQQAGVPPNPTAKVTARLRELLNRNSLTEA